MGEQRGSMGEQGGSIGEHNGVAQGRSKREPEVAPSASAEVALFRARNRKLFAHGYYSNDPQHSYLAAFSVRLPQ